MKLSKEEIIEAKANLKELQEEHQDFDKIIDILVGIPDQDELLLHRIKKRKLLLKDKIYQLERTIEVAEKSK